MPKVTMASPAVPPFDCTCVARSACYGGMKAGKIGNRMISRHHQQNRIDDFRALSREQRRQRQCRSRVAPHWLGDELRICNTNFL